MYYRSQLRLILSNKNLTTNTNIRSSSTVVGDTACMNIYLHMYMTLRSEINCTDGDDIYLIFSPLASCVKNLFFLFSGCEIVRDPPPLFPLLCGGVGVTGALSAEAGGAVPSGTGRERVKVGESSVCVVSVSVRL